MNTGGAKRVIWPLSPPPSAFTERVVLSHPGGDVQLQCTYERSGSMYVGGFRFHRVRAYRFRAESHCTPWHIDEAYDTLVEIEASDWVRELLAAAPSEVRGQWNVRHFLIYVDSAGAYEVAAEDVEQLPEESIP